MNSDEVYRKALSVFPYCTHGLDNDGQVIIYTGINRVTDTTDGFHCYSTCRCGSGPWTNNSDEGCKCGYTDEQSDIALLFETVNDVILRIEQLEQETPNEQ